MALTVEFDFLFAGRDENSFLETFTYDLYRDHGDKSGQIFANLEIQNNPVDSEYLSSVVFEALQNQFFADLDRDPYERFELTLKVVNSVIKDYREKKSSGYIGNINVIIAAIVGDTLYLTQSGDAEAYLIRKRYVSVISEGLNEEVEESEDLFTNIATGSVEPGDFVLFSSTRLLRYISKSDLANSLQRSGVTASLNEIKDIISTEMLGRICLTGVLFRHYVVSGGAPMEEEPYDDNSSDYEVEDRVEDLKGSFMKTLKESKQKAPLLGRRLKVNSGAIKANLREKFYRFFGGGKSRNWLLMALIVVILVLFIAIIVAKSTSQKREEIERLDKILTSVQNKITEAETKGVYDKETAILILDEAYSDAKEVLNSGYYREKAKLFLIEIEDTRDTLDNVKRIESPNLYSDLSEVKSSVNALGFAETGSNLFVYESASLIPLVLDQVQDPIELGTESDIIDATGFDDRDSIVFLTKNADLIEYKDGTVSFMDTADESFRKGVSIDDWSNRIYMLDNEANQIWKYSYKTSSAQFGSAEAYITEETYDIKDGVDLAIDASIFVLGETSGLQRYYAGDKTDFYVTNPPFNDFEAPRTVFANEKIDEVFVLDTSENRVFVYLKDYDSDNIKYQYQYLFDTIDEIRDIYVDADSRKLYLLTSNAVYEVTVE
ncbi:hypothetical protein GF354_03960 [Candidatus Peregrinibacteria bacterium]|nr:hypothetical protein [Candidatus Peregrinibacteria bacterium]